MIIPIIIFFIIIAIIGSSIDEENLMVFGILGFIVCTIAIAFLTTKVVGQRTINQKLEMYQEENTTIETKVKETVRAYMDYEKETYTNLIESADLTTLLVKYPKLNSNELVKEEIKTYKENNKQIKTLKEQKINITIYKWWLYFGK